MNNLDIIIDETSATIITDRIHMGNLLGRWHYDLDRIRDIKEKIRLAYILKSEEFSRGYPTTSEGDCNGIIEYYKSTLEYARLYEQVSFNQLDNEYPI
jgi:hypothetical protein